MLAVDSEQFQSSLRDVVDWCARHHSTIVRDSTEAAERRRLCELANRLFDEARTTYSRLGLRSVSETDEWKRAWTNWSQVRESSGPLESRLRNPVLMPSRALDELGSDSDWLQTVSEVVSKRSAQNQQNPSVEAQSISIDSGRFLIYFPHENLADGAAQVGSNGFFDVNNVPPWDLWVSFSEGALISWVPLGLIELAQMGIDANPEECIRWFHP